MRSINRFRIIASAAAIAACSSLVAARGAQSLPPQAAQAAEVQLEGTLEVLVEDHATDAILQHFLLTPAGRFHLSVPPGLVDLEGLETGTRIRAHGRIRPGNTLELNPNKGSVETLALASSSTFGEQRVAVLLVNFQDTSVPYNWTLAHDVTFNQASNFFYENSYGQTWLTGDVYGWFNIAMSKSVCDVNQIASLADQAATAQGINLNNYSRRVYAFPGNACSWWGLGTVGGNPSRAWVKGSYALKVVAHELGHNFGDYHAKSQPCDSAGCSIVEYGDDRDIMGLSGIGHLNAYQKERLGWLNYGNSPRIQAVTGSGTFWIESLQTPGSAPKGLKILKSSSSSGNTFYYFESRSQIGYDGSYSPGVIVHTGIDINGNSSQQIDLDAASTAFDAVLNAGQSFVDAGIGLTVRTVSSDPAGSWVEVEYAGAPCAAGSPNVSVSPSGLVATQPSQPAAFSVSIRNNDDSACAPAEFSLSGSVPSGWTWSGPASVVVAPGSTVSASVAATPAPTASGTTDVFIQAARPAGSGPGGTAIGHVVVASSLAVSLSISGGSNYQIVANVSVAGAPVAGATVTVAVRDPNGGVKTSTVVTDSNGNATVKGRLRGKAPKGTYQVTATAVSGALSGSASGTFVY